MRSDRLQHRNTSCRILLCQSSKNTAICCKPQRRGENSQILSSLQAVGRHTHFEPFVVESGGELGERAQEIFKKICNLITQTTGQSGSSIAYFWKSRLLVTLAKITNSNAFKWAMAHNESRNPDSVPIDMTDCYDDETQETRRMMHSSGPENVAGRRGADNNNSRPMTICYNRSAAVRLN